MTTQDTIKKLRRAASCQPNNADLLLEAARALESEYRRYHEFKEALMQIRAMRNGSVPDNVREISVKVLGE